MGPAPLMTGAGEDARWAMPAWRAAPGSGTAPGMREVAKATCVPTHERAIDDMSVRTRPRII